MSKKTSTRLKPERGKRHRLFRTEVLQLTQNELGAELNKGQSTVVNLDKGQDIPDDCKAFYTRHGLNWNWYYTGEGNKLVGGTKELSTGQINYANMDSLISPQDERVIHEPLDHFFDVMTDQIENYTYITRAPHFTPEERTDLFARLCERVLSEAAKLEKSI